jgi:hypothetical protein
VGDQSSANFDLHAGFLSPILQVSPLSPIQQLLIKQQQPDAKLWWETRAGAGSYSIYRDPSIDFIPGSGNFVATVSDTFYTEIGVLATPATQQFYIVTANNP